MASPDQVRDSAVSGMQPAHQHVYKWWTLGALTMASACLCALTQVSDGASVTLGVTESDAAVSVHSAAVWHMHAHES